MFPGFLILTVFHRTRQVFHDQFHRLAGDCIGERRGLGRDIGFNGMGQRIHAGGGGEARWHAQHQFRIVDGNGRRDVLVNNRHFYMGLLIGDDAEPGHLGGSAGRGVDGYQWQ